MHLQLPLAGQRMKWQKDGWFGWLRTDLVGCDIVKQYIDKKDDNWLSNQW
jgi:hypothetical protein